ncbi:MAG: imelysin family protein [Bacteroidota bacterium]|nr:imelysin family protein [Bacteroidota bacterium]
MELFKINRSSFLSAVLMLTLIACKDKKEDEVIPEDSFDKSGMLANVGDNLIVPAYANLKIKMDSLQLMSGLFVSAPSSASLTGVQLAFLKAYSSYQWCSAYEFGPAETEYVRSAFNTFPCDTLHIKSKILAGEMTLSAASDLDVKGFPGIDFLLFSENASTVLSRFTTAPDAANAKSYLSALIAEMKAKTDAVNAGWSSSSGNYIGTFKGNTGNDVGGSVGLLVNQLNYDLELLKNAKIGIPLGKKTLGVPQPNKVEALYSKESLLLVNEHLKCIENIYLGRTTQNSDGLGLDDYLSHVQAEYAGGSLNDAIKNKLSSAKLKLSAIPATLETSVVSSPAVVDAAYLELQQLVILLKVDLPSALGVSITYVDNDGD